MKKLKEIKVPKVSRQQKRKKTREAIKLLNAIVKIRLAPSSIHGIGVFAMRKMSKGEKIYSDIIPHQFDIPYSDFNELRLDVKEMVLSHFPLIPSGSHFLYPVTKFSAYLNHSDIPNYDAKSDVLLKNVEKGEEITEDYRQIENWEIIYPFLKLLDKKI